MRYFLAFLLTFGVVFESFGKPMYLRCSITKSDSTEAFSIKFDETNSKISHINEASSGFNTEGFFSSDYITYQKVDLIPNILKITQKYKVDRASLTIFKSETAESLQGDAPLTVENKGSCDIAINKKEKYRIS